MPTDQPGGAPMSGPEERTGPERRAVAVLSVGERPWAARNLPTIRRYAERCGADFHLVTEMPGSEEFPFPEMPDSPGRPHKRVYAAKSFVPWSLVRNQGYERVLMLDDTCIVSPEARNVFEIIPPNHCGFTKTNKDHAAISFAAIEAFVAAQGLPPVPLDHLKYMNSGMVLYDRRFIGAFNRKKIIAARDLLHARYPHQTLLYYLLAAGKVKMRRLPGEFNSLPRDREGNFLTEARTLPDEIAPADIYHVTGGFRHRQAIIEALAARLE